MSIEPAKEYDVVIVGAGPAGLMAATCLTTYGFSCLHIDDRPTPTTAGRADGLQPRTIELLRNIGGLRVQEGQTGLAKRMVSQGVRVYETCFWDPTEDKQLARTSRAPSCPSFIDVVDNYTLLLHQGLIENAFIDEIEARRHKLPYNKTFSAPRGGVFRPYQFLTCHTDASANPTYPVESTIEHEDIKQTYIVRSKYLLGLDGARSMVRKAVAGGGEHDGTKTGKIRMEGDTSDIVWAVCDVELETDFPDIMSKCMIHSRSHGSIMVIPREDGLVRLYVQMQESEADAATHVQRSKATQEKCFAIAKKIFEPYTLVFGRVAWFSVYQIGQRIASSYTLDERVFLGGDATHTHSPKAGQGMNISMIDMYSLAWKLNLVEKGLADRSILLPTYEQERRGIAEELLRFDAAYSRLFSGRSPNAAQLTDNVEKAAKGSGPVDAKLFIETFKKNAGFTSGCAANYSANVLNALPDSDLVKNYPKKGVFNPEGTKLVAGQRLLPGKVTRAIDANMVRIQQEVKMNGAFRIHIFAGEFATSSSSLAALDKFLNSPTSFLNLYRPSSPLTTSSILDSAGLSKRYIEHSPLPQPRNPFFTFLTVFSDPHTQWEIEDVPLSLRQYRDQVYSDDLYDVRVREAKDGGAMHCKYGVDVKKGAVIVVRPDGYVGAVTSLNEDGFEGLNQYFAGFLVKQK